MFYRGWVELGVAYGPRCQFLFSAVHEERPEHSSAAVEVEREDDVIPCSRLESGVVELIAYVFVAAGPDCEFIEASVWADCGPHPSPMVHCPCRAAVSEVEQMAGLVGECFWLEPESDGERGAGSVPCL